VKEYLALNANISLVEMEDDSLRAVAEVIILVSEPSYRIDAAGQIVKERTAENFRVGFTIAALESFVGGCKQLIENMHSLQERASVVPETPEKAAA
jgi:hypothetical protein